MDRLGSEVWQKIKNRCTQLTFCHNGNRIASQMERLEDNTNKDELELHHVIIQVKTLKNFVSGKDRKVSSMKSYSFYDS